MDGEQPQTREQKKPGRDIFWTNATVGYGFLNMEMFEVDERRLSADLFSSRLDGPGATLAVGTRLMPVTLAVRGSVYDLNGTREDGLEREATLWSADAEIAMNLLIGSVQPFFLVGGGYSMLANITHANVDTNDDLDVNGANVRGGLGLWYFVTPALSVGGRGTAELLFLNRPGVPLTDIVASRSASTISEAEAEAREAHGSSVGAAYAITIGPGLHF
jgi:hypothetical protein